VEEMLRKEKYLLLPYGVCDGYFQNLVQLFRYLAAGMDLLKIWMSQEKFLNTLPPFIIRMSKRPTN